jgi:hypothetical protein
MLHNATNAQTAEHYGALGVLSFLLLLSRTNHLLPCDYTGKYIVIWIDNAEVQRRFNTKPKSIKVGTYVLADMELWHTIHAIKALLPFKVVSQLVKWHQDRHHKFEDLEFNAQLNILADKAADTQYTHNNPYQETPPLPFGGVIYYRDKNGREITDTYKYLQHEHHGGKLRDYIQKKHQWNEGIFEDVDWNNLKITLGTITPIELTHRVKKMMHGWQNTGRQKKIILDFKRDHDDFDEEDSATALLCPMCKEVEDQLHYTRCEHKIMKSTRSQELKHLIQKLRSLNTYEGIVSVWAKSTSQSNSDITLIATNSIDVYVQTAFTKQQDIGWHNLLRGFISTEWNTAQSKYIQAQGQGNNSLWASKAIGLLQHYTLNLWNYRNSYLIESTRKRISPYNLINFKLKSKNYIAASTESICLITIEHFEWM